MLPAVAAVAKRNVCRQLLSPHSLTPHLLAPHLPSWLSWLSLMSASVLEKRQGSCVVGWLPCAPTQAEDTCVVWWLACAPRQLVGELTSSKGGHLRQAQKAATFSPHLVPLLTLSLVGAFGHSFSPELVPLVASLVPRLPLASLVPSFRVLGLMCACAVVGSCRLSRPCRVSRP